MKIKSLLFIAALAAFISSCGINDLEDRLDKVEDALGTNEPLKVDFRTTNDDNQEVAIKKEFLFKTGGYDEYFEVYSDGWVYVYIERFSDVEWSEGARIYFSYNLDTKEISDEGSRIYFYDKQGNWINPYFAPDYIGHTFSIKVNSINAETGLVDVDVTGSTSENADYNEFEGKPMSIKLNFRGKIDVYNYE